MRTAAILLLLALAAPILATSATANDSEDEFFETPSGNIGCHYFPVGGVDGYVPPDGGPELTCVRKKPDAVSLSLGRIGKAKRDGEVNDTICCDGGNVIDYGRTWRKAIFACMSAKDGLTCNRKDGHGFSLSRAKAKTY